MRILLVALVVTGCGNSRENGSGDGGIDGAPGDACVGFQCRVVDCAKQGKPLTSISGTVYAPNGTLALYGAMVYTPNLDPGPLPAGAQCDRCMDSLPGDPIARVISDE